MSIENANTVFQAFQLTAQKYPDRPAFCVTESTAKVYDLKAGELSYDQVLRQSNDLADRLEAAGYGTGMRVAVLFENRPDFFVIWLALNKLDVSIVPLNPDLRRGELAYILGHAEPALVLVHPSRFEDLQAAVDDTDLAIPVAGLLDDMPAPRPDSHVAGSHGGCDQEAALLYTSGTTGQPKGCVLPNTYFLCAGQWYRDLGGIGALSIGGERMITPLPVFHMNAMAYSFMAMVFVGGCLIALDRFHPSSWWQDVKDSNATCLHYLGVMPSILLTHAARDSDTDHKVRFGFGAGVDPALQVVFEDRFGFPLIEAWAMTETGAGAVVAAATTDRNIGRSCFGRPSSDVEIRIVGDAGLDVATGQAGELLVRHAGPDPRYGFFRAYYKNAQETAEAWRGGWFHSGDIVRQDPDGNMFFVDRKKNVIRRSGENISAVEVESLLARHPKIKAAGVTAVPDDMRGDEVFACLLVDEKTSDLADEIARWCLGEMAYYKVPGYIAFVDGLPLTATQKIQRAALKTLAVELLQHPATQVITHLKKRQVA